MDWTTIDPDEMYTSANHTAACLGELETHLKALVGTQDEMQAAVTGATGMAIYNALGNSFEKGRELANFLENIVNHMQQANVKLDGADLEGAGLVNFETQFDQDGNFDASAENSQGTGSWNNGVQEKVDTKSWA